MSSSLDALIPSSAIASSDADLFPTVTIALDRASVLEDGDSSLVYLFTRSGEISAPLTVRYALKGTAVLGLDYTGPNISGSSKTVRFAASSSTATLVVKPIADTIIEASETVSITLASSSAYRRGTTTAVTGTITNDDVASTPVPSITLDAPAASVTEDGTANLVYTFTRTGSTSAALSVNYTVGGTATLGSDYSGISTAGTTKTVTFAAGSATASVTVDPTADTTVESNETVALTLAAGSGYTIGTTGAVTGSISNDDVVTAPLPSITLGLASASVSEDGTANLVYTFTRTGSTSAALSVNYTVGGTATLGSDYSGISTAGTTKTVSFAAGSATASVTVDPTADTTVESNETVALTLGAGSGYTIGTTGAVTGTIANDDVSLSGPGVTPAFGWLVNATTVGLTPFGISGEDLPVYTGPYKIPSGSFISGVRFISNVDLSAGDIIIEKSMFQPTQASRGMPIVTTTDFNNASLPSPPGKVVIRDSEFDGSLLSDEIAAWATGFWGIADMQRNYIHHLGGAEPGQGLSLIHISQGIVR